MARPKIEIDEVLLAEMAEEGCKIGLIATYLGVSEDTIKRRYAALYEKARSRFLRELAQNQLTAAKTGSAPMLKWLGQQHLDQKEKVNQEVTGRDGRPLDSPFQNIDLSRLTDKEFSQLEKLIEKATIQKEGDEPSFKSG